MNFQLVVDAWGSLSLSPPKRVFKQAEQDPAQDRKRFKLEFLLVGFTRAAPPPPPIRKQGSRNGLDLLSYLHVKVFTQVEVKLLMKNEEQNHEAELAYKEAET